jgi:class 3 adenylate cyclase
VEFHAHSCELLETVYKAFDSIAVRRRVFKVETIGDCYVAVAGLPDPQEDHATIMTKFASDCIFKMGQLKTELAHVLGADTAELALRVVAQWIGVLRSAFTPDSTRLAGTRGVGT